MKTFRTFYRNQPASRRTTFAVSSTATGCAILLLAASGAAGAADQPAGVTADSGQLEEVVVTGIRAAIESAIEVKKQSDSIVEALSAEDIGKLPDTSVAESLARLPGVAAQRTAGRDQQISIRGMGPDFTTGLLNGREQVSTGDSRAVEYDQYPSELVNAVTVYKTADGSVVGQGLAGTVDIQTIRPLSRNERTLAANYRREKLGVGTKAEGTGNRYSLAYVDQYFDHKLGLSVGFARLDETGPRSQRFESWGGGRYDTVADVGNNGCTVGTGGCVSVPYNGFNVWSDQTTQRRDGMSATVQFEPNDKVSSTLDLFYAKFESSTVTKGFQAPMNDSWAGSTYDAPGHLINPTIVGDAVTAGTFDNVRAVVRNDTDHTVDKLNSYAWKNKLAGDVWTTTLDLSYSKALKDSQHLETTAGTTQDALGTATYDTMAFTSAGVFTPGFDYTNRSIIKLTDVQGWGGGVATPQAGYSKLPHVEDKLKAGRLDFARDLSADTPFKSLDWGFNVSDRKKTREYIEGRLVIAGQGPLGFADVPGTGTATLDGISFVTFDPVGALSSGLYNVESKQHPDIFNKDWTVTERLYTFFGKAKIEATAFGLPIRGNLGLQVIRTDQGSVAFNVDSRTCANDACQSSTNSVSTSYNDFLPSLNLTADLGNQQNLRFGLAKQMARPTLQDMRASFAFSLDTTHNLLTGSGGNPNLRPFRANAIDLTYEKYFGKKAYVAVQGFYKNLSTYVIQQFDLAYDFAPYVNGSTVLPVGGSTIGQFTHPVNGSGGRVEGVELAASFPFDMLTSALEGFGVQGSYSITNSSVQLPITGVTFDGSGLNTTVTPTIPLPGLSKHVSDLTLYFERWGFAARVSQTQRSDFIGEVSGFTGDRQLTFIKGEKVVDAQLSYELQSGFAKGLQIQLQAHNLTNSPFVRYGSTPSDQVENTTYGKNYLLGINYRL